MGSNYKRENFKWEVNYKLRSICATNFADILSRSFAIHEVSQNLK